MNCLQFWQNSSKVLKPSWNKKKKSLKYYYTIALWNQFQSSILIDILLIILYICTYIYIYKTKLMKHNHTPHYYYHYYITIYICWLRGKCATSISLFLSLSLMSLQANIVLYVLYTSQTTPHTHRVTLRQITFAKMMLEVLKICALSLVFQKYNTD